MKYQVLSDLHLDIGRRRFQHMDYHIDNFYNPKADGLIVAGDIAEDKYVIDTFMERITSIYKHVIYVTGNHEYWSSDFLTMFGYLKKLRDKFSNLSVLDDEIIMVGEKRVLGGTLWFKETGMARVLQRSFSDFRRIDDADPTIYHKYENTIKFLETNCKPGDIVITHHTPSQKSIPPEFANDNYNVFFSNDLDSLIEKVQPSIWIHGHTHQNFDYTLGNTRILCNPFAYPGENKDFKKNLIIEV